MVLGSVPYREDHWYEMTSGIVSVPLVSQEATIAAQAPIAVVAGSGGAVLLTEADDGLWVRADRIVYRLSPGDRTIATLHATRFGSPAEGLTVSVALDPSNVQQQQVAGPLPGPPAGVPASALTVTGSTTTDGRGRAEVELSASDPGTPRCYIDGQVYGVTYGPGPVPPPQGSVTNPAGLLNVLVWSGVGARAEPTWIADIEPIFTQYARLYPVMRPIVDLADYADVVRCRTLLLDAFSKPIEDPGYMPVTRDLSPAKRDMIVRWPQTCRYLSIDSVGTSFTRYSAPSNWSTQPFRRTSAPSTASSPAGTWRSPRSCAASSLRRCFISRSSPT